jgi:hypothetical protein
MGFTKTTHTTIHKIFTLRRAARGVHRYGTDDSAGDAAARSQKRHTTPRAGRQACPRSDGQP